MNKSREQRQSLSGSWHKATPSLTTPCSIFKSSTKDLSLQNISICDSASSDKSVLLKSSAVTILWSGIQKDESIRILLTCIKECIKNISPLSSMDSGLEAFSLNPTRGSFSALTFQSTEFANYVNQRFLSYWVGLLLRRLLLSSVG